MGNPLASLPSSDLKAIREAIESRRLEAPFGEISVGRCCSNKWALDAAEELQRLTEMGCSGQSIADLLGILAEQRLGQVGVEDLIDLVWTGPEAPGAPSRDTSVVVSELFSNAQHSVLVAGYAVYQGRVVFRALAKRMEKVPGLTVKMFLDVRRQHGDTTADSDILRAFAHRFKTKEWPGERRPQVYYDPRALEMDALKKSSLHAKCVVVDRTTAFVSSANFTEAAQVRNIEVGVLIRSADFASHLARHFEALADCQILKRVPGT